MDFNGVISWDKQLYVMYQCHHKLVVFVSYKCKRYVNTSIKYIKSYIEDKSRGIFHLMLVLMCDSCFYWEIHFDEFEGWFIVYQLLRNGHRTCITRKIMMKEIFGAPYKLLSKYVDKKLKIYVADLLTFNFPASLIELIFN